MKRKILAGIMSAALLMTTLPSAFAEDTTWGFTWNYDNSTAPIAVSSSVVADDTASAAIFNSANNGTISHDDGLAYIITAAKFANTNADTFTGVKRSGSYGINYTTNHAITDGSVLVSTDFMLGREGVGCYLLAPEVSGSVWFPCALYVDKTGHMSMANGCRYGGDNYSVDIADIDNYKWYNVAIKYTYVTDYGIKADVYLNGEKKADEFCGRYDNTLTGNYLSAVICDNIDGYRTGVGRSVDCNEGVYFDNTYIGNDFSKIEYNTMLSEVSQPLDDYSKINAHFNQEVSNSLTASDIKVLDGSGAAYATVDSISWTDEQTAVLTLNKALGLNTEYTLTAKAGTVDTSKSFKTKVEYLYNFDNEDMNYMNTYGRTANVSGNALSSDSYTTSGKGLELYKKGTFAASATAAFTRDTGYGVQILSDAITNYTGSIKISLDFMLESENINGAIAFNSTTYDNILASVEARSSFDADNNYTGTKLYFGKDTELATLEAKKWYRLNIDCTRLLGGTLVIESVSLDGTKVMTTGKAFTAGNISRISALAMPVTFSEGVTTNEKFHIDNLYIGTKNDYNESKAVYTQTKTSTGAELSVSAGANENAGTFIAALYNSDGILKEARSSGFDAKNYSSADTTLTFENTVEGTDSIKTFIWNDTETLKPYISPNTTYEIQQ